MGYISQRKTVLYRRYLEILWDVKLPSQSGPTFGSGQLQAPFTHIAFPGQLSLLLQTTELVQVLAAVSKGSPFGQVHLKVPGAFWHRASLPHDVLSRHSSMSEKCVQ